MNEKLETIANLLKLKGIRMVWDREINDYYYSILDTISVFTDCDKVMRYWKDLKLKLLNEGSNILENVKQIRVKSNKSGRHYMTDALDTKGILRLIESIPNPKVEQLKIWLTLLGKERMNEIINPELAIIRAISYYKERGYKNKTITKKVNDILNKTNINTCNNKNEPLKIKFSSKEYQNNKVDNKFNIDIIIHDVDALVKSEFYKELLDCFDI